MIKWLDMIKHQVEESTYTGYKRQIEGRTKEYFTKNPVMLEDLKPVHILDFYNWLYSQGLKGNTVVKYHANIRKALDYAVQTDLIQSNPAIKVGRPQQEELKEYTPSQRFAVYLIKHKGQAYTYNRNDNIIQDSYSNKNLELSHLNDRQLLDSFKNNTMLVSMIDTHQSNDLSAICYAVLEELVKTTNNPIKKCQNCGMYFIPNSRLDEIYCDYPKANGKTCKEQGAVQAYNERLKQNKALAEYRRLYQLKSMAVGRNKDNKQMKKDFDKWKKDAKDRVNKLKHKILTEDEVYEWLVKNK